MKDNPNNIAITNASGEPVLPLNDFFVALRQNSFSVSPKQIADCNSIINEYASSVQNEDELCAHLSSIIANTKEEQLQFKEIFDSFFKTEPPPPISPPPAWREKVVKHLLANKVMYTCAAVLIISAIVIFYFTNRPPVKPIVSISVYQADTVTDGRADVDLFSSDSSNRFTYEMKYSWGDGTAADTTKYHFYKQQGVYKVKAIGILFYRNKIFDTATAVEDSVTICVKKPQVKINTFYTGEELFIGDSLVFSANVSGDESNISWTVTGDTADQKGEGKNFTANFKNAGEHIVYCSYSPVGSLCSAEDRLVLQVKDNKPQPVIQLVASAGSAGVVPSQKVEKAWYYITAALALIGLFLAGFFATRWNRARNNIVPSGKETEEAYQKIIDLLNGQQGSKELAFGNKNYLPLPEKEMNEVARMMRMRIRDESPYMDVDKTIAKAVINAGFFNPVYSTRTQQCEYLVLIDDISADSQQVKLFEYLLELLEKQNVFIEKFYYRRTPVSCYNTAFSGGISLEKLSERFPRHVLLIMGNAYQLLYNAYPVVDNTYLPLLNRWQYKAILTPVSFIDWGIKEKKGLQEEFPVAPVDIPGQLLLMKKLFVEEINVEAALYQYNRGFYEAETIDFENIDELYAYCENAVWANEKNGKAYSNILFQWIAALGTWPLVNWQMTLAIGKAILDKEGKGDELNFTNLLRIARIKWMREGRFPDYIRTELLKKLSKENEVTARETILALLNEIPVTELHQDHFAYEEKETQKLINEFILYAYDPGNYPGYQTAKDVFGKMKRKGEIMDMAALEYLENDKLEWETLINNPKLITDDSPGINTSLTKYFAVESGFWKKLYLWCTVLSSLLFLASVLGFIGLVILGISGSKSFPYFTTPDIAEKDIRFSIKLPAAAGADTILTVDNISTQLKGTEDYTIPVSITGSLQDINISVDGNSVFDTSIIIDKDAYEIYVPVVTDSIPPVNNLVVRFLMGKKCADKFSEYSKILYETDATAKPQIDISENYLTGAECISEYSYGAEVGQQQAERIANGFRKNGIVLAGNLYPNFTIAANEIVFYSVPRQVDSTTPPRADTVKGTVVTPKAVIQIQVSDRSLISSATEFRKDLMAREELDVKQVTVAQNNYNSEITFYDERMRATAQLVKRYYNKYYPAINAQARLRTNSAADNKNTVVVWIQKLVPGPTDTKTGYSIEDIKLPKQVNEGDNIDVAFTIKSNNIIANAQQNANGNPFVFKNGRVCIAGTQCITFVSATPVIRSAIQKQLTTKGLKPGTYAITVVIDELKISQSIGTVVIAGTSQYVACDTIRTTVDRVSKGYYNADLEKKGIQLKANEITNVFETITVRKGNCPEQKQSVYNNQRKEITFCDNTMMYFTLSGKNITAVICKKQTNLKVASFTEGSAKLLTPRIPDTRANDIKAPTIKTPIKN